MASSEKTRKVKVTRKSSSLALSYLLKIYVHSNVDSLFNVKNEVKAPIFPVCTLHLKIVRKWAVMTLENISAVGTTFTKNHSVRLAIIWLLCEHFKTCTEEFPPLRATLDPLSILPILNANRKLKDVIIRVGYRGPANARLADQRHTLRPYKKSRNEESEPPSCHTV